MYWSRVQVKSLAFQGLNLYKVRTLLYPLRPQFFIIIRNIIIVSIISIWYFINGFPRTPVLIR